MNYVEFFQKTLQVTFIITYGFPYQSIQPATAAVSYSKKFIFLEKNSLDIIKPLTIRTTAGAIEINKNSGQIISKKESINSSDYITLGATASKMEAQKNITTQDTLTLDASNCSVKAVTGTLTTKKDITITSNGTNSTISAATIKSDGAVVLNADSCTLKATSGELSATKGITMAGTNCSVIASGDITSELSITINGQNSSIKSSSEGIRATSRGSKIAALASGSTISATTPNGQGVVSATNVEAHSINARLLITPSTNILDGTAILQSTTAQGTITADIIYADKVYATTVNFGKVQPGAELQLVFTAQQIVQALLNRSA